MRIPTMATLSILLGLTACGASNDLVDDSPGTFESPQDMKVEPPPLMAHEEQGSFAERAEEVAEDEEYFGEEIGIVDEDELHPADAVPPRTLGSPEEPTIRTTISPADRVQPADIGDPRLQAKP